MFPDVRDYGAEGDGTTDDLEAFEAAIEDMNATYGGGLYIPPLPFKLDGDWTIDREVRLVGGGRYGARLLVTGSVWGLPSLGGFVASDLTIRSSKHTVGIWAASTAYSVGQRVYHPDRDKRGYHLKCKTAGTTASSFPTANWSPRVVYGSSIEMNDGTVVWEYVCHSVICGRPSHWDNCLFNEFTDSGLTFQGRASDSSNCSVSSQRNCSSINNGGHGFYIVGPDANAISMSGAWNAQGNGGYGACMRGFLGSHAIGGNSEGNYGSIVADGPAAWNQIIGLYAEGGQEPAMVAWPSTYEPSNDGAGVVADCTAERKIGGYSTGIPGNTGNLYWSLGTFTDAPYTGHEFGILNVKPHTGDGDVAIEHASHTWYWDESRKALTMRMGGGLGYSIAFEITTSKNPARGGNRMRFPDGALMGGGSIGGEGRLIDMRDAVPSASASERTGRVWRQGDVVFYDSPKPGGPHAWRFTKSGGWGGGPVQFTRQWAAGQVFCVGDGTETAGGDLYRVKSIPNANAIYCTSAGSTPSWPGPGYTVTDAAGIVYEYVGPVGGELVEWHADPPMFAATDGSTITIDWLNGWTQTVTLAGNRTIAFSSYIPNGRSVFLLVVQDSTGNRTLTWPGTVKWVGGTAPTLSTGAGKRDVFQFVGDGTNLYEVSRALDVR